MIFLVQIGVRDCNHPSLSSQRTLIPTKLNFCFEIGSITNVQNICNIIYNTKSRVAYNFYTLDITSVSSYPNKKYIIFVISIMFLF